MTNLLQRLSRSRWLATWLQDRRRQRQPKLLSAPVLQAQYPSLAVWEWPHANPVRWHAYNQLNGVGPFAFDDWMTGSARQYAPDGGQHPMYIVGVDANDQPVTHPSNVVVPDSAPIVPAPVLTSVLPYGDVTEYGWADLSVAWTFNHAGLPVGVIEVWLGLDGLPSALLFSVPSTVTSHSHPRAFEGMRDIVVTARYRQGAMTGPWSAAVSIYAEW
jgi:hypothetical protein